ncbi:MAG: amidohydrolase family protein [Candidatus Cloacimonetes bacterium]|jgi:predicted TIM-barrel fold metal-dependent hydrolase/ubiquinone/menaquinone biosynthesis C-methylase UbiE|nr:amidohydrolase family protein [Candidatus Cloacimonadota bacterium]MBT4333556.1 amidohydrolase family protein [Candidatus Cloacimonadota bacterium]MBT4575703.1 amidohydrolase family protein [Candidatus Cloacimonadota bacterium]MBT5420075.1 amidohydrolase family protein [Candidatus Cloacimonadota bacterium]
MIIDGHAHAAGDYINPESIIKNLDKSGVDKVILVPGELESTKNYSLPNLAKLFPTKNVVKITNLLTKFVMRITGTVKQIPKGNEYVYNLTQRTNGRVIQFIWITQQIDNPTEYLNEKLTEWNFKGVKLHQCWEDYSVDSDFFRTIAEWAEKKDLPLFIHLYSDNDVKHLIEYKKEHPKLKLIIAHLFGLELFIKDNFKDSNLYFDTSTSQLTSTKRFIDAIKFVGAANITFGTDTPYGKDNLQNNIDRIRNLDISTEEKDLILGENMSKLLKIQKHKNKKINMDSFEHNRKSWNELTTLHANSIFYDIDSFKKGKTSLNQIEINELGDIKGKRLLHLQCHFGMDTLSLARQGAEVVGVDISDISIQKATELSNELKVSARFVRSNIYDIESVLNETFDIVYTSYGAINWLNDLDKWAKIISRYLKPNGIFYMVEFHPFIYTLNNNSEISDSYFKSQALETAIEKSYTDKSEVSNKNLKHIEWHHSLSEVLNSLISNGLKIEFFNEFPYQVYNCFPNLTEIEKGRWVSNKYGSKIPHMYSIRAKKI